MDWRSLPHPWKKFQEQGRSYNRINGKRTDDEKATDGFILAMKVGNATGAKEPCFGNSFVMREGMFG